jgi:hypothetical protein
MLDIVRVRMLKPMVGVLDTVSLSRLVPGLTYDVDEGLAKHLISCGAAEETASTRPALVVPVDDPYLAHVTGGITVSQVNPPAREVAADQRPKVRQFRKPKRR